MNQERTDLIVLIKVCVEGFTEHKVGTGVGPSRMWGLRIKSQETAWSACLGSGQNQASQPGRTMAGREHLAGVCMPSGHTEGSAPTRQPPPVQFQGMNSEHYKVLSRV